MISMKKILITLTVLFAVIDIMAQEHLSFKGIPIEGSMTEFCQKLKSKVFTCKKLLMTKKKLPVRFTGQHFTIDKVLIKDAIRQANISRDSREIGLKL